MESREEIIRDKMRNLIIASCNFDKRPTQDFIKFHKDLLNFFFNSIVISIDYDEKLISIWNSKPLTTDPVRLYDLNEAIADKVCYTDLEETLNGCLEEGKLQNNFYKKLLFEYGSYSHNEDMLSA